MCVSCVDLYVERVGLGDLYCVHVTVGHTGWAVGPPSVQSPSYNQ